MNVEAARELYLAVADVLDAADVKHFLILGTCLGAIREGGFIEHDADVDLGCFIGDFKRSHKTIVENLDQRGLRVSQVKHPWPFVRALVIGNGKARLDLCGLLSWRDLLVVPSTHRSYVLAWPARLFVGMSTASFCGRDALVPTPADEYLEYHYGPKWRTPNPKGSSKDGRARVYGNRVRYLGDAA